MVSARPTTRTAPGYAPARIPDWTIGRRSRRRIPRAPARAPRRRLVGGPAPLRPNPGDASVAGRAAAVRSDALLFDRVAGALDQQIAAIRAVGVFPATDPAWEVAGVDEPESGARPDLAGAHQR